jgi:hypothetical protein
MLFSLLTPAYASRHKRIHKVKTVCTLFPTAGSLARQDAEAERLGLKRIQNDAQLHELTADGILVTIRSGRTQVTSIAPRYRFLRPWTEATLTELAENYYFDFKMTLFVSSAVRPMTYQRRLARWNHAAAAPDKSVHPVGIAFDLPKNRLTKQQRVWLQWKLWYWTQTGRVIVEEERACFHVVAILSPAF